MQLTNEQKDQLVEIMKQIHEGGDTPLYQEQCDKMKDILQQLQTHVHQMTAIVEANPIPLTLFEFALSINIRSADDEDTCIITGEKTQVRKGLLMMVNRVNNKEYRVDYGEDDE